MNLSQKKWIKIGFVLCSLGFGVLIYSIRMITVGGLNADAGHTSGSISVLDITSLLAGLALSIGSIILFSRTIKELESNARNIALWSLVSSLVSLFVYFFVIPTIVLGLFAISKSKHLKTRPFLVAMSTFAIVTSIIGMIVTFTTS